MQTFITSFDISKTAQNLDNKRLGKQRVEAIQIARSLLGISNGWLNHPAVKMWKGYEAYLVKVYLRTIMDEWINRGYKNDKCEKHWQELMQRKEIKDQYPIMPNWITIDFCKSHQSNLIRKLPGYYGNLFPNIPDNLPYIWPI